MSDLIVSASRSSLEPVEFIRQSRKILKNIVATKNFDAGCEFIVKMDEMGEAFNRVKAIMISGMDKAWNPSENDGETFLQFIVRKTSLSPETIVRHTRNQSLSTSGVIPGEFRQAIEFAPENCRLQIANLIEDGYEPTRKEWLALSEVAKDRRMVGKIVRKIRKVEPRTNWSMFTIDERGIVFRHSKEKHEQVGVLNVFSDSQFILDGIEKMKRLADIKTNVEY